MLLRILSTTFCGCAVENIQHFVLPFILWLIFDGAHKMEWSEDAIAQLRALWMEGHSTAEIGRRMGVTKNAVVGKAHRLKLCARPSPIRHERRADARPRPARASKTAPAPSTELVAPVARPGTSARAERGVRAGIAVLLANRRARHAKLSLLRRGYAAEQALLRHACAAGLRADQGQAGVRGLGKGARAPAGPRPHASERGA